MLASVIIVIISFASTTQARGSFVCGNDASRATVFKCKQGSNCVSIDSYCDGTKDCEDGSDEASCPETRSGSRTCNLPPYPSYGTYEVFNIPKDRITGPGQSFESFLLRFTCDSGYGVVTPWYPRAANESSEVFCVNGKWSQPIPECARFCRLDPDPSVIYLCSDQVCPNYVAPGELVNPICNSPVYISTEGLYYMTCNAGVWDYVARCRVDCGRISPLGLQLILEGNPARRGELPWHVGIYRKPKPYTQVCSGSLVTNDVVISAAHCFWSDHKMLHPTSDYAVAVGKLYRDWNDKRDVDAQKSYILQISIPSLFQGGSANFQEDIAVLILKTSIEYKTFIRPVCLNFEDIFDRLQLHHGNIGKVAGWGLTGINGAPSPYLKVAQMPFVNEVTCISALPATFRPYITGDKFCAGYTNGTAVCQGDSGGGLVFSEKEQGMDRYYLRGIVSTAPNVDGQKCNNISYTTFTKITKHQDFIKKALAGAILLKSCKKGQESNCHQNSPFVEDTDSEVTTEVLSLPLSIDTLEKEKPKDPYECILPPQPNFGSYEIKKIDKDNQYFVLTVTCNTGYLIKGTDKITRQISCFFGHWNEDMLQCHK